MHEALQRNLTPGLELELREKIQFSSENIKIVSRVLEHKGETPIVINTFRNFGLGDHFI